MTVSQILVENVNVTSIEIFQEQDFSISLVRHQESSMLCRCDATRRNVDAAIIYVGVNDILNNQSHDQKTQLMYNLRKTSAKYIWCKTCFCFRLIVYLKNKKKFVG